jgi:hypothetical protein
MLLNFKQVYLTLALVCCSYVYIYSLVGRVFVLYTVSNCCSAASNQSGPGQSAG